MSVSPARLTAFFKTRTLGSPNAAIGFVLWRLVHRFQREINRVLAGVNLTHLQFTVLALVAWTNRTGQPVSQAELSRAGDIEPMQVSQILTVLERKGYVVRRPGQSHPRAKSAEITPAGLDTLRKAMTLAVDVQGRLFGKQGAPGSPLLDMLLALEAASLPRPVSGVIP